MKFFKNFWLYGNKLYIRECVDGVDREFYVEPKPKLYVRGYSQEGYRDVFGVDLKPIQFDTIKDARAFAEKTPQVWGFDRYAYTTINEMYSGEYDPTKLRIVAMDIESDVRNHDGFPDVMEAIVPTNAITISFKGNYFCFTTVNGKVDKPYVRVIVCPDETTLYVKFLQFWEKIKADIVTGWNINGYDIPMLYNRIKRVLGDDSANRLSPYGHVRIKPTTDDMGRISYECILAGLSVLDYMDLYKKFRLITRESYKLDFIANVELGDSKVEYDCPFKDFAYLYPDQFLEYNVHDVALIDRLEAKLRMIGLVIDIAYFTKCNFEDCMKNSRVWDIIIANHLMEDKIIVPYQKMGNGYGDAYEGAFVKAPLAGMYNWLISLDAESLYPSNMIQYNISPETALPRELWADIRPEDIINKTEAYYRAKAVADKYDATLCGNGVMYSRKKKGFVPVLAEMMFLKRKEAKKEMLKQKGILEEINAELIRRGLEAVH